MNRNFNDWYIESCITLNEEQLKKRWECIEFFCENITCGDVIELVKIFYNIPANSSFKDKFVNAFIDADPIFSKQNEQEVALLAGAVLAEVADSNGDLYSFTELLNHSVRFGARSPLINAVYMYIEKVFLNDMKNIREKATSNRKFSDEINSSLDILKTLENTPTNWNIEISKMIFTYAKSVENQINDLKKLVDKLKNEETVYFEDSQILWWLTSGWSRDKKCSYKNIDVKTACITIGKEAAELISVFPGPYSVVGVLSKMLENCKKISGKLKFVDVISNIDNDWKIQYKEKFYENDLENMLPISSAIVRSINTKTSSEWIHKYSQEVYNIDGMEDILPMDYALQIYYEILTQKCYRKFKQ